MKIEWNVERCPSGRPYVDVRVIRELLRGQRVITLDAILFTRRVLVSVTVR